MKPRFCGADGVEGRKLVGKSFKIFGIFPADFGIGAIDLKEEFKGGHFLHRSMPGRQRDWRGEYAEENFRQIGEPRWGR